MRSSRQRLLGVSALVTLLALGSPVFAQQDALKSGFDTPPESAKPRTWWHWTNGNITQPGITKDMEWMRKVGIGGMMLADVSAGSGQTLEEKDKIHFFTPEWFAAVKHAANESKRLGLEMSIFNSAGWSLAARSAKLIGAPRGAVAAIAAGAFCGVWAPSGCWSITELATPPSSRAPVKA